MRNKTQDENLNKPQILVVDDSLDEKLLNQLKKDLSDYEIQRIEHISENSSWITARHETSPYGNRKQRRTQMANYRKSLRNKK